MRLFTRGGWVVKKGQNFVYVVVEWPKSFYTLIDCWRSIGAVMVDTFLGAPKYKETIF